MKTIVTFLTMTLLAVFFGGLIGCGVAQVALEKSREADVGDINVAKTGAYDPNRVAAYNRIVVMSRESQDSTLGMMNFSGMAATGGASAPILSGRIALELTKAGYDILEKDDLERAASDEQMKNDVIGLAKKVEADAILTTVVQQGTVSKIGTFGLGAGMETGIVSTSIKLIDITDNRTVAVISSDYPEPRTATEAIEGLLPALFNVLGKTQASIQKPRQPRDPMTNSP